VLAAAGGLALNVSEAFYSAGLLNQFSRKILDNQLSRKILENQFSRKILQIRICVLRL
jgi:hypothetical protein